MYTESVHALIASSANQLVKKHFTVKFDLLQDPEKQLRMCQAARIDWCCIQLDVSNLHGLNHSDAQHPMI
jgi:hypothetical protein